MNFVAIDFETADTLTPCELGICVVSNGTIVETRSWLIKPSCYPYINHWHQQVHGISAHQLKNAPCFDAVWKEAVHYLGSKLIIAHNARFDIGVLRESFTRYGIATPDADYLCSVKLSRSIWPEMESHRLNALCDRFGIKFTHHRAGADAEACARVVQHIAKDVQTKAVANQQPEIEGFRREGMSIIQIARELKAKPQKL